MASSQQQLHPPTLLTLPQEMLDEILNYLLLPERCERVPWGSLAISYDFSPTVLAVNHRLHQDGCDILYGRGKWLLLNTNIPLNNLEFGPTNYKATRPLKCQKAVDMMKSRAAAEISFSQNPPKADWQLERCIATRDWENFIWNVQHPAVSKSEGVKADLSPFHLRIRIVAKESSEFLDILPRTAPRLRGLGSYKNEGDHPALEEAFEIMRDDALDLNKDVKLCAELFEEFDTVYDSDKKRAWHIGRQAIENSLHTLYLWQKAIKMEKVTKKDSYEEPAELTPCQAELKRLRHKTGVAMCEAAAARSQWTCLRDTVKRVQDVELNSKDMNPVRIMAYKVVEETLKDEGSCTLLADHMLELHDKVNRDTLQICAAFEVFRKFGVTAKKFHAAVTYKARKNRRPNQWDNPQLLDMFDKMLVIDQSYRTKELEQVLDKVDLERYSQTLWTDADIPYRRPIA
ncbi:hypothetical protein MMC25_007857 [Agyrium rufum]|nr:hypothetical protein [Agyrium rufum]